MKFKFLKTVFVSSILSICCFINVANAGLIKSYDFNGDLSDTIGNGVDMIANGGSVTGAEYHFTNNQGLKLTSALSNTSDYAIEMRLRVIDSLISWNKLIDFSNLVSDNGLYLLNGNFDFYVSGSNPLGGPVNLNEFFTIAFVRSAGVITTHFNGVALTPFNDSSNQAVPSANILNFFEDDTDTGGRESFVGAVDFIRIHDDASTFGTAPINVPEPSTLAIFALGMIGLASRRFKKQS
ncbi:PEP-CTERM sorting domain-containing protein [Cognaticolwellia beringensis]|uniref:PEP-CTERM sorting domain-containing protein n=1 Tax=Cognaticolwellia beringensis TaxID=1967665 RepID=A0A222GCD1_9GAMM|nr:PEP-CTERM sorting domain-containing protein [Cognaticolwellia beringensis]ASP49500.1 PEP-CTERM sorting domain-containing protein [Cognaticolwellia beringensis]